MSRDDLKAVCVLKSGGAYSAYHVVRLREQIGAISPDLEFICLSDVHVPCERIPLRYDWPGWWSKIELFNPDLDLGPCIYLDLDVSIVGDISKLAADRFTMCADFIRAEQKNSSVMAWSKAPEEPFWEFRKDPYAAQKKYKNWPKIGDQALIEDTVPVIDTFNSIDVLSYKFGGVKDFLPVETSVVAFHGKPKPWYPEVQEEWAN